MADIGTTTTGSRWVRRGSSPGGRRWLVDWAPALPLLSVLVLCLVAPVVVLLARSLVTVDGIGLSAWARVLSQPLTQRAIITSVELGLVCATISVLIGTPLAWLVSRMVAGRRAAWLGLFNVAAHFGGIGLAFAYIAALGAAGMVTQMLRGLGVAFDPPPSDSFAALVIAYEHANIPLFVLLTLPAMALLRQEWWEAAQTSSATRLQFWRRVGLPLLAPFIGAGFVLSFTWSIGIFGIAYALVGQSAALPVPLITLQIGQSLADDAVRGPERAAVLAVVLMAMAFSLLFLYRALVRRGLRWLSGGGAAGEADQGRPPGGVRLRPGSVLLFAGFTVYLVVPVLAVMLYSVAAGWTGGVLPDDYTLRHWVDTFQSARVIEAFTNSLFLASGTTFVVLSLSVPAVYWAHVRNRRIRPILEMSAAIPFALPFVVIGFAMLQFSGLVMPGLQGTYVLLLLVYVAISFPFVYWALDSAMAAAGVRRLAEAAAACGASPVQTIRRVVLPSIRSGLATAAMLAFALVIGEFALIKVLANSIVTIPIWSAAAMNSTSGSLAPLSVVTTVVFAMLFALSVAIVYVNRGRLTRALPGVHEGG